MIYPKSKELIQAQKLMHEAKFEAASQILDVIKKKEDLPLHELISYYITRSLIAVYNFNQSEFITYANEAYKKSHSLENSILLIDSNRLMAFTLVWQNKLTEAGELIKIIENLINTLPNELSTALLESKADFAATKGWFYYSIGDMEKALKLAKHSLSIREELNLKVEIGISLFRIGESYFGAGDLNLALEYTESCLSVAQELNYKYLIQLCNLGFGNIYSMKGELDLALNYSKQALKYYQEENNQLFISLQLNNMGITYQEKGDFNKALESMEKGLEIKKSLNIDSYAAVDSIFQLSLDMKNLDQAQKYLNQMQQIAETKEDPKATLCYRIDKAIFLKHSPRSLNRGKAEEMLKSIIEEGISEYQALIPALLNLCDLLMSELSSTREPEILEELQFYISHLFETVKTSRSYSLLAETYLLQGRLALITLDTRKARQYLVKAQEIAEKYDLDLLARKISNEHDELLKQLETWKRLEESNAPLTERMEASRLNDQMDNMLRKRVVEPEEIKEEESVVILIISTGGIPIFSQAFAKGWAFKDHLFGGFLSAINSFSGEMFSEGLDRAIFGEYTILMNAVSPFIVCYLFKGQSFLAQKRMKQFSNTLQTEKKIWESIKKYYQAHRLIQEEDVPSLDILVNDIFIERATEFN